MKTTIAFISVPLVFVSMLVAQPALAKDDPIDFLHALQDKGYPDLAIEYLNGLKDNPDAPKDIMEVWDLEMSRSYKAAAKNAYGREDFKNAEKKQKEYLDKFIKENPNRPEALAAAAEAADEQAKKAVIDLARANAMTDAKEKAELLESVRKTLAEVRPRFQLAVDSLRKRVAAFVIRPSYRVRDEKTREDMKGRILDNRLNMIIIDFYMAMSYADGSSEHKTLLDKASKSFDDLFQETRSSSPLIGLNAHYWQGRVLQDLKKFQEALDVYEEILAADSDTPDSTSTNTRAEAMKARQPTGLEPFFAEVQLHYLQCLKTVKGSAPYFKEAPEWRLSHKLSSDKTSGYQALSLELAKAYVDASQKAKESDKQKLVKLALEVLREIIKVESPSTLEAIRLKKQLQPNSNQGDDSYDENIAGSDAAVQRREWAKAIEGYEHALEHHPPKTPQATLDKIRGAIAYCMLMQARDAFDKNKPDEANDILAQLLKNYLDTDFAPAAAKFRLEILFYQLSMLPEKDDAQKQAKDAALEKVKKTAGGIISKWPGKPEADSARLTLMKIHLQHGELNEAKDLLQKMNEKSEFYGTAHHLLAATAWRSYNDGKLKVKSLTDAGTAVPPDVATKRDEDRKTAMDTMRRAVEILSGQRTADAPMSPALVAAELAYAKMCAEGGDWKESVKHYEQLLNNIQKTPNAAIDKTTLDVFNGAVSAYLQIPDIDKAAAVSSTLLKLGPDEEKVNLSLIAFAMKLEMERKGLQSKLDATPPPPESEASEMRTKRDSYVKLMEDLLKSLSARENLSTKNKVWIAQKAGLLGFDGITTELAKKLLAIPDLDPKAIPSLRKLLVEILARQNHFEDAIAQVDDLIKQFPRALEPQLTKGEILEKWAKKEPSKYDLAVQHWEKTRRWLQRVPPDKNGLKVPEYYDITYREAKCLFEVAQKTSNKEKALDGLRIVQQVLMFDPKMKDKSKRSYSEFERYTKLSKALQELSGVDVNKTTATEKTSSN